MEREILMAIFKVQYYIYEHLMHLFGITEEEQGMTLVRNSS
jgi:hypothetical protein